VTTTTKRPGTVPGLPLIPPHRWTYPDLYGRDVVTRVGPSHHRIVLADFEQLPRELGHLAGKVVNVNLDGRGRAVVQHAGHRVLTDPRAVGLQRDWPGPWYIPDALRWQTYRAQAALSR